jgi:Bacterial cell division membrane protein
MALVIMAIGSTLALFSTTYGKSGPGIPTQIVPKQILFEILGFISMVIMANFDYHSLRRYSKWLYGISIFLLFVVFILPASFGAHSWIPLGLFAFQPSEFAKLTLIIAAGAYLAHIDETEDRNHKIKHLAVVFCIFIVPFMLTLKEPALGQALVMFAIIYFMYMAFAKRWSYILLLFGIFILVLGFTYIAMDYPQQSTNFIQTNLVKHHLLQSFQADRVITWLNPGFDPSGSGYNVQQAQLAIGSGQLYGDGFLKGTQTHAGVIPNQWTDFIFTAISEQFGFVGSAILILAFLILIWRLTQIASTALDTFGTYFVTGIIAMFAFQVFENIGMNIYLSPATGITLPFISYGGSSLIANYMAVGLALNVYSRSKSVLFKVSGPI